MRRDEALERSKDRRIVCPVGGEVSPVNDTTGLTIIDGERSATGGSFEGEDHRRLREM
jgi:hypothetical protein